MSNARFVLLAKDEQEVRDYYRDLLRKEGYEVDTASSGAEAVTCIGQKEYCVIILDILMPKTKGGEPSETGGIDVLRQIRDRNTWVPIIMLKQVEPSDEVIRLMYPLGIHSDIVLSRASETKFIERVKSAEQGFNQVKKLLSTPPEEIIYAKGGKMESVLVRARQVAKDNNVSVLITGETGVGKEFVAREIHRNSNRESRSMQSINIREFPTSLVAAELFGHKKGAFTDAHEDRKGLIKSAQGSTLFIDEIGESSLDVQVMLLRFLQGDEEKKSDLSVVMKKPMK